MDFDFFNTPLRYEMRVTVVQSDPVWENASANLKHLEKLLTPFNGKTDLAILPEMFNTGFSMRTDVLSEPPDGETWHWMKEMSLRGGFGLCGSYLVSVDGKVYNRWVFVSNENEKYYYDKRHTFSIADENKYVSSGASRLVFSFRGVRIGAYICYDLRFPVWSRNLNDTDLMIYSANWPEGRRDVWNILLRARAIENQCYVAGSNRTGTDGNGIKYSGDSVIINPRGEIIASADTYPEQCISSDISMDELSDFRKKFPVANDADSFTIHG